LPIQVCHDPFYSKKADALDGPREYAGLVYHLTGDEGLDALKEWQGCETHISCFSKARRLVAHVVDGSTPAFRVSEGQEVV
jgi:hypothetical protein